ncbi:hypothetical protein AB0D61_33595, partial [Streptomyces sp. NPDC048341]
RAAGPADAAPCGPSAAERTEGGTAALHGAHRPAGDRRLHGRRIRAGRRLLLGTSLGSHNRLTVLEEDGAADRLADWCHGHWGDGSDRAQRALATICRAIDFWGARGWLASDPAAALRT